MSKYYVVWIGRNPGIYNNWPDAYEQTNRFKGAKHKSFETRAEAVAAFKIKPIETKQVRSSTPIKARHRSGRTQEMRIILGRLITELRVYRREHPRI